MTETDWAFLALLALAVTAFCEWRFRKHATLEWLRARSEARVAARLRSAAERLQ